jgi:hypothetical protein
MPTPRFGIAPLALIASTLSCSVLIDTTAQQCSTDTDCANLGDAFAGSVCQANVCVKPEALAPLGCPDIDPSSDPTVKLTFSVSFAGAPPPTQQPFMVEACKRLDTPCAGPVGGPIMAAPGVQVELEVPTGFEGFLQVTNPDPDTLPAMVFLGQKAQQDTRFWDLTIPRKGDVTLIGLATNTDIDPSLSTLIMIARDCDRTPLAGVVATNSTGGTPFYFSAMAPDRTLMATTEEGAAGFTNVPAGTAILGGTYKGRPMSPTSVESRGAWFSYAEVFP